MSDGTQHSHCLTCYTPTRCLAPQCPIIECADGCGHRFHSCKQLDHRHVCGAATTACINAAYGCPARLARRQLGAHLTSCPASIVVCSAVWGRRRRRSTVRPSSQLNEQERPGARTAPLDVQLAWRDQNWLIAAQTRRQMACVSQSACQTAVTQPDAVLMDRYADTECVHGLGGGLCRLCAGPAGVDVRCQSPQPRPRWVLAPSSDGSGELCWRREDAAASSRTTRLPDGRDAILRHIRRQQLAAAENATAAPPPPALLSPSELQLSLAVEHTGACRLYEHSGDVWHEMRCDQIVRRDELADHRRTWHELLAAPNWLQAMCPRRQYGCSFYSDRLLASTAGADRPVKLSVRVDNEQYDTATPAVFFSPVDVGNCSSRKHNGNERTDESKSFGERISLMQLPVELLLHIVRHLDSAGLRHVAATCCTMRHVAATLLPTRGMVVLQWRCRAAAAGGWSCFGQEGDGGAAGTPLTRWCFSRCTSMRRVTVSEGHLTDHMRQCACGGVTRHSAPFSIVSPAAAQMALQSRTQACRAAY